MHNDSDYFIESFVNIFTEIFDGQINWFDFAVGMSTIILIVSISFMDRIKVQSDSVIVNAHCRGLIKIGNFEKTNQTLGQ